MGFAAVLRKRPVTVEHCEPVVMGYVLIRDDSQHNTKFTAKEPVADYLTDTVMVAFRIDLQGGKLLQEVPFDVDFLEKLPV